MKKSLFIFATLTLNLFAFGCSSSDNAQKNAFENQNTVNSNVNSSDQVRQRHEERAANMRNADSADSKEVTSVQSTAQTAPENSEITVSLGKVATETRTFKGHATIDKVVKTTEGKTSSVKVYLKDGKVVDLPGDKIPNIRTIPVASIVAAIGGVKQPEQKPLPPKVDESEAK